MRRAALAVALAVAGQAGCKEDGGAAGSAQAPVRPSATDPVAPGGTLPQVDEPALAAAPPVPPAPVGLPETPSPDHNPTTPDKVELGRHLFFEPRLSGSGKLSCAGCHRPSHGWSSPETRSSTDAGRPNLRHTPTLFNVAYHREWSWDGSMPTLEALVMSHWKGQMSAQPDAVGALLSTAPGYAARFERAFSGDQRDRHEDRPPASPQRVVEALAAFVRTVRSGGSLWDHREDGQSGAVLPEAVAGFEVFSVRAGCPTCHPPPFYTDHRYHDRGIGPREVDPGRMRVTADPRDAGAFKTPSLRDLVTSAPYFHDGSATTLDAAVDAELLRSQVTLAADERLHLLAFLRSLSPGATATPAPERPAIP